MGAGDEEQVQKRETLNWSQRGTNETAVPMDTCYRYVLMTLGYLVEGDCPSCHPSELGLLNPPLAVCTLVNVRLL